MINWYWEFHVIQTFILLFAVFYDVVPTLCGFEEYLRATHMLYTFAIVLYTSNISTQEVEAEGPWVQVLPGLYNKTLKKETLMGKQTQKPKEGRILKKIML